MQYRSGTLESISKLKQLVIGKGVSIETYEIPLDLPLPTSLPQEQAAKLICFQWLVSKYLTLCTVEEGVANACL